MKESKNQPKGSNSSLGEKRIGPWKKEKKIWLLPTQRKNFKSRGRRDGC